MQQLAPKRPQASTHDAARSARPTRRGALRQVFGSVRGWGFLLFSAACAIWTLAVARFMIPNTSAELPGRFRAGRVGDYPFGHVEDSYRERYRVWVVHGTYNGQRQIFALRTACTHLGCVTRWVDAEQTFKCPCHGSVFSRDGLNIAGPAPRPLQRCAIRLAEDGRLEIDRNRIFQEELGQWKDPASYVTC